MYFLVSGYVGVRCLRFAKDTFERISSIGVTRSKIQGSESRVIRRHAVGAVEDRARTSLYLVSSSSGTLPQLEARYKYTRESSPIAICDGRTICCRHVLPTRGKAFDRSVRGLVEGITCAIILRQPRLVYRNRDMDAAKECRE